MIEQSEIDKVEQRTEFIENDEISIVNKTRMQKQEIESKFDTFMHELRLLNQKTHILKVQLAELNKSFLLAVKMLRQTASKSDLEIIEKKVDTWSPEKLITKKEFRKLLQMP